MCFASDEVLTEQFLTTFNDILTADDETFWLKR
jgi:hypothetical protein